jgi:hypothetical protein
MPLGSCSGVVVEADFFYLNIIFFYGKCQNVQCFNPSAYSPMRHPRRKFYNKWELAILQSGHVGSLPATLF